MHKFSSLLMALTVTVLLWGNCAHCSVVTQSDSQSPTHDCCSKPQDGKPLKQNCDLTAADLSKAFLADHHQVAQPAATPAADILIPDAPSIDSTQGAVTPVSSPPQLCLLYSVFRL